MPDPSTTTSADVLVVGDALSGTMNIDGGSLVQSRFGRLGSQAGSTGTVTIGGVGSGWNTTMSIGYEGHGQVNVIRGGSIRSTIPPPSTLGHLPGSTGIATIRDLGSSWTTPTQITVGNLGEGILIIEDGGVVDARVVEVARSNQTNSYIELSNGTLNVGALYAAQANLHGTGVINTRGWLFNQAVTVQDLADMPTSFMLDSEPGQNIAVNVDWTNPTVFGTDGAGSLSYSAGEEFTSRDGGYIGFSPRSNSSVTIQGVGSSWRVGCPSCFSAPLRVGNRGEGALDIVGGANVWGGNAIVGFEPGSVGNVVVDGAESSLESISLNVGWKGEGNLSITNGGRVSIHSRDVSIVGGFDSTGRVFVDGVGSTWTSGGGVSIGGYLGESGMGTLEITDGGRAVHIYAVVGSGATGHGVATIQAKHHNSVQLSLASAANLSRSLPLRTASSKPGNRSGMQPKQGIPSLLSFRARSSL